MNYKVIADSVKNRKLIRKKVKISAFAVGLCMTASVMAQNCSLINSVTLSAPAQSIILNGNQGYVNNVPGQNFQMPLELNQWHYIAFTKGSTPNAGPSTIYLDGQLVYAGNYMYNNFYNWTRFILGHGYDGSAQNIILPFEGYIDEVRISNVVRSQAEILAAYQSNNPLNSDANTIGLWHLDQSSGTNVSGVIGQNGTSNNVTWSQGVWGNCAQFNGLNSRILFNQILPTNNITCEFWIKPTSLVSSWPISYDGSLVSGYSAGFLIDAQTTNNSYNWSTGATGNTVTVDPSQMPYVWVTDGNCTDTVWFDSQSATVYDTITTNVTVYDTLLTTVTDTLIINTTLSLPAPNNENTILIYPNPASDHITIDNGNYTAMAGYSIKIENNAGQQVFQSAINQAQFYVDLSTWTGNGLYFVHLIDPQNNTVTVRKIVLQ